MKTQNRGFRTLPLAMMAASIFGIAAGAGLDKASMARSGGWECVRDSVEIHFRQSKIDYDPTYMGNDQSLKEVARRISVMLHPDSMYSLEKVEVLGAASPEGSVPFNKWLSENRADVIVSNLSGMVEFPDSITGFTFTGRDWKGLLKLARRDEALPYREETLDLLSWISDEKEKSGETERNGWLTKIKNLRGGVPYKYMYTHLFPSLRRSHVVLNYRRPVIEPVVEPVMEVEQKEEIAIAPDTVYIVQRDTVYIEYCPPCKPFYMDIRTNMLYDAATIPNIGVEFYLGKGWSIGANWQYAWWSKNEKHRYWRFYGGDINVRKWFGSQAADKPLSGHHLGIYGQVATFDFEFGGRGYMGGKPGGTLWDRTNYGGGIEYGYSLPVAKRLNIDFTIGLGAFGGKLVEYRPGSHGNYYWTKTKNYVWFGPTKAEISLAWMIGCANKNVKVNKNKKANIDMEGGAE